MSLRIFLSCDAPDLVDHRRTAIAAIRGSGHEAVCRDLQPGFGDGYLEEIRTCDAAVVVIGRRHSGSSAAGAESVARLTWETARDAGIKTFAYVVDPPHPLSYPTEQDFLSGADGEAQALEVYRRVRDLETLIGELRDPRSFTTPVDLARSLAADLDEPSDTDNGASLDALLGGIPSAQEAGDWGDVYRRFHAASEITPPKHARRAEIATGWKDAAERVYGKSSAPYLAALHALAAADTVAGTNAVSSKELAVAHSLQAREAARAADWAQAWGHFRIADERFGETLDADPGERDAKAALGGLLKRAAGWKNRPPDIEDPTEAALEAYESAADVDPPHAYPLLQWLVERAVRTPNELVELGDDERDRLKRALHHRRRQHDDQQDAPWPAFDLALGGYLLDGDLKKVPHWIETGVRQAMREAPYRTSNRMVAGARLSWKRLLEKGTLRQEAWLALAVFDNVVAAVAGELPWHISPAPTELLAASFRGLRTQLDALAIQNDDLRDEISGLAGALQHRWDAEDEAAFEAWIETNRGQWEPEVLPAVRVLWKAFGGDLITTVLAQLGLPFAKPTAELVKALIEGMANG